jgi:enamine deaminase RidA (YjgF/YER057c/UK114 family)
MISAAVAARGADVEPPPAFDVLDGQARLIRPNVERGTSLAVVVDAAPLVHTAQVLPLDSAGKIVGNGNAGSQAAAALENLDQVLRAAGASLERVVKLNVYVAKEDAARAVRDQIAAVFHGEMKPAVSFVVTPLAKADVLVGVDAVALLAENQDAQANGAPQKVTLAPAAMSAVVGSAQSAVLPRGGKIYVSGQAEKGDDLKSTVRKTIESLRATLKFLGRSDADIVEIKGFVKPMTGAGDVYQVLAEMFGKDRVPPVSLVEWESDLPIEIELVAWAGPSTDEKREIEFLTPPGMTTPTIYSRVTRTFHPRTIYTSGLYGEKGRSGEEQVEEIFAALGEILADGGSDLRHLLKATYYVSDKDASEKLNEIRPRKYDPARPPAASKAMVKAVGKKGKTIAIDLIAVPAK